MCKILGITRQNYYKYRNTTDKDYYDYLEIKRIFEEGKELYGAKRIEENVRPNLLKRNFKAEMSNKKWSTDITYLIHKGKRMDLSSIMDLNTRNIIAYKISKRMDNKLVMNTLNEAIRKQKDVHGLIIHSDQGFQYTSNEYKAICEANGIIISMSPKGSPVDSSPIESFHLNLKRETLKSYNTNRIRLN